MAPLLFSGEMRASRETLTRPAGLNLLPSTPWAQPYMIITYRQRRSTASGPSFAAGRPSEVPPPWYQRPIVLPHSPR